MKVLKEALLNCRAKFALYVSAHMLKGTAEATAKAITNLEMVGMIDEALAAAKAIGKEPSPAAPAPSTYAEALEAGAGQGWQTMATWDPHSDEVRIVGVWRNCDAYAAPLVWCMKRVTRHVNCLIHIDDHPIHPTHWRPDTLGSPPNPS